MLGVVVCQILVIRVNPDLASPNYLGKMLARFDRCEELLPRDSVFELGVI